MKLIAKILSILFHPLLLPTYAIAFIIYTNPYLFSVYQDREWIFVIRVFINTFLFPAVALFLIWKLGFLKDLTMPEREDRIIPYIATGTLYVWAFITFRKSSDPQILNTVLLGSCIALFGCFFVNIFNKVSIHSAGIACMAVIVMFNTTMSSFDTRWVLLVIIFLAGLIGVSRQILKAHSTTEVLGGYMIGIAAQLIAMRFM
ncbi:MAG: phosphatase PAP2 family protein [Pseudomonadota bacterium]